MARSRVTTVYLCDDEHWVTDNCADSDTGSLIGAAIDGADGHWANPLTLKYLFAVAPAARRRWSGRWQTLVATMPWSA